MMRQALQLILVMGLAVLAGMLWYKYNPPPPANYEIIYFGKTADQNCKDWKINELREWRADPISRTIPLRVAELYPGSRTEWNGGFGTYDSIFTETFGRSRSVYAKKYVGSWPNFVVMKDGEVYRAVSGRKGWREVTRIARDNARRIEREKMKQRRAIG